MNAKSICDGLTGVAVNAVGSSVAFCMGIRLNHGPRHLAANVIVSAVLLSGYVMAQKLLF